MSTAATMLDLRPPNAAVHTQLQADSIDVLFEVSRTAQQCAAVCLQEPDPPKVCISLAHDAADVTMAAAYVVVRMTDPRGVAAVLDACCEVLQRCEEECRRHGSHLRQCQVCADVCSRAEELCLRLAATLRSSTPNAVDDHGSAPSPSPAPTPSSSATAPVPPAGHSADPATAAVPATAADPAMADPLSPGAALGRSSPAPEPNEPA